MEEEENSSKVQGREDGYRQEALVGMLEDVYRAWQSFRREELVGAKMQLTGAGHREYKDGFDSDNSSRDIGTAKEKGRKLGMETEKEEEMVITGMGGGEVEAEYVTAKTCVWWDIENCAVPRGCNANVISKNISSALADSNYRGPVSIYAYGDTHRIPSAIQNALSSTGVSLYHVPGGVKDGSDKKILVRMLLWAVENPPPANVMLISGDRDFADALHQLRMRRYSILLGQPQRASAPLVAAAKTAWLWTTLVAGGPPLAGGEAEQLASNGHSSNSDNEQSQASDAKSSSSMSEGGKKQKLADDCRTSTSSESFANALDLGDYWTIFETSSSFEYPLSSQGGDYMHASEKKKASNSVSLYEMGDEYVMQNTPTGTDETIKDMCSDAPEYSPSSAPRKPSIGTSSESNWRRGTSRPCSCHNYTEDFDYARAIVIMLFAVGVALILAALGALNY